MPNSKFPKKEAEVVALAETVASGLTLNAKTYPNLPILVKDMQALITDFIKARDNEVAKHAIADSATIAKNKNLEDLIQALKKNLRYAENTVDFNNAKLEQLGWSGRKLKGTGQPPGETLSLEKTAIGDEWISLAWKKPVKGGRIAKYNVERKEVLTGEWEIVATVKITETNLVNQPVGKDLRYRVFAQNASGEGDPSNSITVKF